MRYTILTALLTTAMLGACASNSAVEQNLGKAVAQMRHDQVSNPSTLTGPQDQPVVGVDPEVADEGIKAMRKDTPERATIKRDIMINVGTQQGAGSQ
jgi:guanyl-specific ribonuclease Sa